MRARELLNEAYSDRLEQAAQYAIKRYGQQPVDRDTLLSTLANFARELPLGSVKPQEFARDALRHLGTRIKIQRKSPSASERSLAFAELKTLISRMADELEYELGNIFPDGDSSDAALTIGRRFAPKLTAIQRSLGDWGSTPDWYYSEVYPKVKEQFRRTHKRDIDDYLADMWDDHQQQAHYDYEHGHTKTIDPMWSGSNPYRVRGR